MPAQTSSGPQGEIASPWLGAVLFLTAVFLLNFLSRVSLGPLLPHLEVALGLGHAQAGGLLLWLSLGYFVSLFASGLVSQRLGHHRTVWVSAVGVGVVLLVLPLAEGTLGLGLALLALGVAAGPYLPSGIAVVTDLADQQHWGRALAVHEMAPNLSFVCGPLVAQGLADWGGWQSVPLVLGAASLLLGLTFARWGRGGRFPGRAPDPANLLALARRRETWLMMLLFGLGIGASMGVYLMLPLFLVSERGFSTAEANLWLAASRLVGVGAALAAGWVADRLGPRGAMAGVLAGAGLLTVGLGLAHGSPLWLALFLQPTVAVCFFPAGFAVLSRLVAASERSLIVSAVIPPAFVLGGGLIPAGIGWLGEELSFAWGLGLAGGLIALGSLLVAGLRLGEGGS